MRVTKLLSCVLAVAGLLCAATPSWAFLISGSSGGLTASVDFSVSGNTVTVVLTNTSAADVTNPSQVLTAVFFDVAGVGALTPVSATLTNGSTVLFPPPGPPSTDVGGEFAYASALAGAPNGATEGISSSGLGLFGPGDLFPPQIDLDPPLSPAGLNYGLTSAGDNPNTGNAPVTGDVPLITNSVTFTLTAPISFVPSSSTITNVSFQFGASLDDPNIAGSCTGPTCFATIPQPAALMLLGAGLIGMGGLRIYRGRPPNQQNC